MAAKMKLCRSLSKIFWYFVILAILSSFSSVIIVESATTAAANGTDTTTVPPTTQAVTTPDPTTTTVATTTILIPSGPKTVIGETVVGQCLCDLTGNKCDINCCCDSDCTEKDLDAFRNACDLTAVSVDGRKCFQESVFLFSNSPATTTTNNGLFCIYYDNYKERNFYLDPDFILDIPSFNQYSYQYGTASRQLAVSNDEPVYTEYSYYTSGDTIYVVYPNLSTGTFLLPAVSLSNQCNDQNSISYLQEEITECTRVIPTLDATSCSQTTSLNAISFYSGFKVVTTSGLFAYIVNGTFVDITTVAPTTTTVATAAPTTDNTTADPTTAAPTTAPLTTALPPSVNVSLIQDLYNNPYVVEIDVTSLPHLCLQSDGSLIDCTFQSGVIPSPTYDTPNALCQNVVQEVRYFVTTDGTNGITQVRAQFVFRDITGSNLPLTQRYSISFNSVSDSNDTVAKSGNPGYVVGKPVLYGTLNITQAVIQLPTTPSQGFTIVRASATGECSAVSRTPIKFGENMRSGCIIKLNVASVGQTCQTIQTQILQALEGPNSPPNDNRYVATFGNTAVTKIGDWVRIIADNRPKDSVGDSSSCPLSMGVHIQVLYANVGALAIPQAKIIGVAYLYDTVKDVQFQCTGASCLDANANLEQVFEVSQTVSFIDVSQPATKFAGEAPIFIARVPNDFFYPFLYYSSGTKSLTVSSNGLVLFCAIIITLLTNWKYLDS